MEQINYDAFTKNLEEIKSYSSKDHILRFVKKI